MSAKSHSAINPERIRGDRLKAYRESFKDLKGNAQVVANTVGFSQTLLLADRSAMDHILDAIRKIKAHSAELVKGA